MKRTEYLDRQPVVAFVEHLRQLLNEELVVANRWHDGRSWECNTLLDAAEHYRFGIDSSTMVKTPGVQRYAGQESLAANARVLSLFAEALSDARRRCDNDAVAQVCVEIQFWGGTGRGEDSPNVKWLRERQACADLDKRLCGYLDLCEKRFGNGEHYLPSRGADRTTSGNEVGIRSNAGLTKIYSLAFGNFAIYDARVAAALGRILLKHLQMQETTTVPDDLNIRWTRRTTDYSRRDPAAHGLKLPVWDGNDLEHLWSNVRVNWILREALVDTKFEEEVYRRPERYPVTPLRALEAALFMLGYDVTNL